MLSIAARTVSISSRSPYFALARLIRSAPAQALNRGCLMVNTSVELAEPPDDVTDIAISFCQRVRTAINAALESIPSVLDRDARADMLVASQFGLLAGARLDT